MNDKQRSKQQNKAIHLFCSKLADELNGKGYYIPFVLKPTYELRWDTQSVKENLWKPIQNALLKKEHTADLNKNEVTKIHNQLMLALTESPKLNELDYIDFPSEEQTDNYLKSYEK